MSKDQFLKFLKNPLWIIVILLIAMIFQIHKLSLNIASLDGYLFNINEDIGWIREAVGKPSEDVVMKEGINERLVEILDKLGEILYKLR